MNLPDQLSWELLIFVLVVGVLIGSSVVKLFAVMFSSLLDFITVNAYFRSRHRLKANSRKSRHVG